MQPRIVDALTNSLVTPAFVVDLNVVREQANYISLLTKRYGCKFLYSLKALALPQVLRELEPYVAGFSCSSVFESRLAQSIANNRSRIHVTSPGISTDQFSSLACSCGFLTFNSLTQADLLRPLVPWGLSCGLRINPMLSFIHDDRYDPCRPLSKLGVPIDYLASSASPGKTLENINGIHFHTNCDSVDFENLLSTVERVVAHLGHLLRRMIWINLGGGYIFDRMQDTTCFEKAVRILTEQFGLDVYIEPGATVVRDAGIIVSKVLDIFTTSNATIAILDSSVNHMPEVFEYQFQPEIVEHDPKGTYRYLLAGCSCLAGDVFGTYTFSSPLNIGSRVTFSAMGAYTYVKANMFNGIPLPRCFFLSDNGQIDSISPLDYQHFLALNGAGLHASV